MPRILPGTVSSSGGRRPGAPTIGTATAGNAQASVTFTAPSYLGKPSNNNIYTATSNPEGITGTSTTSPITVTGLTNGTGYTFTVTLSTRTSTGSVIATSNSSASSNSITPLVPGPFFPFFPPYFPFFPPYFPYFPFFPPYFPTFVVTYNQCTSFDVSIGCASTGCCVISSCASGSSCSTPNCSTAGWCT